MQASVTVKTDFPATVFIITVQGSEAVSDTPPPAGHGCPDRTPPATVFCLPTALPVPKSHSSAHGKATGRTECPFPYTRYSHRYHSRALVHGQSTNGEFSRYPADSSYRHLFCCVAPSSQDAFRRLRTLSGCIQEERGKQIAPPAPARVCSCLRFPGMHTG